MQLARTTSNHHKLPVLPVGDTCASYEHVYSTTKHQRRAAPQASTVVPGTQRFQRTGRRSRRGALGSTKRLAQSVLIFTFRGPTTRAPGEAAAMPRCVG